MLLLGTYAVETSLIFAKIEVESILRAWISPKLAGVSLMLRQLAFAPLNFMSFL